MTPENWQKAKIILEKALETSPASRPALLAEACGGDEHLRQEIEALLEFDNTKLDLLEQTAFSAVFSNGFHEDRKHFTGKQIGKYKIIEELGAGGMGVVFLAERTGGEFEQQVAVKFLRHGLFGKSALSRFLRERQILARLRHPFIAGLIDGGATEDGTPYLVMEYIEGTPITSYAEKHNLSTEQRLDLFRKVCEAVSFAHQNLIVHRDLKPDNILITADGSPKLLDFGIAKLLSDNEINHTQTRHQALTPEYASPEQIKGETITTASDVYCLGIILYELLTGSHPFRRKGKNSASVWQAIHQSDPPRPSSVSREPNSRFRISNFKFQRTKNKDQSPRTEDQILNRKSQIANRKFLRGDLDNIVLKALRREPERRYKSVGEFSQDIKNYLRGFPVSALPDTFFYRAERFIKRNPLAFVAILVAFVSLLAGLLMSNYQARIANAERARAERRFNDVRQLANSFMFEINEEIKRSPVKAREKLVARAVEYLDTLAQEAEGDAELESELATAYEKIGDVQSELFRPSLGKTSDALISHQKALQIREKLFAAEPQFTARGLKVADSRLRVGDIFSMSGRVAEARAEYREAVSLFDKLLALEPGNPEIRRKKSEAYARLGQSVLRSGSLTEALEYYEKALEISQNLLNENSSDQKLQRSVGILYSYIGYVKIEMGETDEAIRYFRDALAVDEKIFATDPGNKEFQSYRSISHLWYGIALSVSENGLDESLRQIRQALEIQKAITEADRDNFGEQNSLADCYLELGRAQIKAGQASAAIENLNLAIKNYEAVWQTDRQNLSARRQINFARRHLGDAFQLKKENAKALQIYRQTLEEFEELTAADPNNTEWRHDLAHCLLKIGEVLWKTGDKAQAKANLEQALPILEKLSAESPKNIYKRQDLEAVRKYLAE